MTAILVGVGGGYGAVGFRWLIGAETNFAMGWLGTHARAIVGPAGVVVPLVIGGAIVAFIVGKFAAEAKGHGVPEVMAAVALKGGVMRPRVIAVKSVASATCIGFGGSCGREGPIVQIGSTIGSVLGQLINAPAAIIRTLVACGAAAGISATFNAPIGGVFFASEVILGEFAPRSFAAIVVSSVTAAVIGRAYLGNRPSFDAGGFHLVSAQELWLYGLLGLICALTAACFVRLLYLLEDRFEAWKLHPILKTSAGFALVGVIGIFYPQVFGVGYEHIQQVLYQHVPWPHALMLGILKPLATSLTLGSGGSGGVFSPSLYTGAMIGNVFGHFAHQIFPTWTAPAAAYGLVAMAGVFAAAAEAPITAITIVFEMSNDYTIVLPLMITSVIATVLGRYLIGSTVYELKLQRRGIDWAKVRHPSPFSGIRISSIERKPSVVAQAQESVHEVLARTRKSNEFAIPVVDGNRFLGTVTTTELAHLLARGEEAKMGELARPVAEPLRRTDTLEKAIALISEPGVPLLPVVEPITGAFLAIVTRRDVLAAYQTGGTTGVGHHDTLAQPTLG